MTDAAEHGAEVQRLQEALNAARSEIASLKKANDAMLGGRLLDVERALRAEQKFKRVEAWLEEGAKEPGDYYAQPVCAEGLRCLRGEQ